MKRKTIYFLCFYLLLSCSEKEKKEFIVRGDQLNKKDLVFPDSLIFLKEYKFPEEHIRFFNYDNVGSHVQAFRLISPMRSIDKIIYVVDNDIQLSVKEIDSLAKTSELEISSEVLSTMSVDGIQQHRTRELVNMPMNIRVCGINVVNDTLRMAVLEAIENYNDLDLELTFEFVDWFSARDGLDRDTFDEWRAEEDIDIIITETGGKGGLAGFPSNGLPFDFITIGMEIAPTLGLNVATHVVTHEIGHCIGFRHTDYFDRTLSCGVERDNNGNIISPDEGEAGIGAIYIPGTRPNDNLDTESIMMACYNSNQTGEFSDDDETALNFIYGEDEEN